MMGVGAKRALGLYRSCAPRQFLIGFQPRPASSGRPVIRKKKKIAYRWIDFLRSTGAHGWPDGLAGRATAAEGETGLDFAGEKSAC